MNQQLVTRSRAMLHSPALPKILFVLVVDALTSVSLIVWEHAHEARIQARNLLNR